MVCIRCNAITMPGMVFCDKCIAENRVYAFLNMTAKDYIYYVEHIKPNCMFKEWFEEGLGPITHINPEHWVWSVDINLLKNSLIEG